MKRKRIILFFLLLNLLSSCILETRNDKEASELPKKTNLVTETVFFNDSIDYNKLVVSSDSLDFELIALIRNFQQFSPEKLLENATILIERGANPNNNIRETSLTKRDIARIPIVKHFVTRKYKTIENYTTAFHEAVAINNKTLVSKFLELGFSANLPTKSELFPLDVALVQNNVEMVYFLIENDVDLRPVNLSYTSDIELIIKLVELGANPKSIDINFALDNENNLEKLVKLKPNLSTVELDFEKLFANQNNFNLLIDNGLNPNIKGKFPFTCSLIFGAVKFGTLENIRKIIQKGGKIHQDCAMKFYSSPLIAAIEIKDTAKISFLIRAGISPNKQDWKGETALSEAIIQEDELVISTLIAQGANINFTVSNATTPLHYAVKNHKYIAAEILLEKGAKVNAKDTYGRTALVFAIENKNLALIRLLLENGADKTIRFQGKSLKNYAEEQLAGKKIIELFSE